jgi:LmbE family N-acetylglucosaminyl deacetylase
MTEFILSDPCGVIFQPHNDDAVIALGGTLQKLLKNHWQLHYLYITDGRHGSKDMDPDAVQELRQHEAAQERNLLGLASFKELGYADQSLKTLPAQDKAELVNRMHGYLEARQPHVVWIPSPGDLHPDHQTTHDLALMALQGLASPPLIIKYSVWLLPNFYDLPVDPAARVILVGIDDEMEHKIALIRCHRSQIARRRYDQAVPHLNAYFAWMMKAEQTIQSQTAEIMGLYTLPGQEKLEAELLQSLAPEMDITEVVHGREN